MITAADPLPDDLETAHRLIRELLETLSQQLHLNAKLQHQLEQLLRHRYGRKGERVDPAQLLLFAQEILAQAEPLSAIRPEPRAPAPSAAPPGPPGPRPPGVPPGSRRRPTPESRCPRACPASRSCTTSPPEQLP